MRIMVGASVMFVALGAMLSASLRAPAQEVAESEAVARDRARYAGTWRLVAVETNGEAREEADRAILVVNRADGSWTMTVDGTEMNGGESRIDPLATPPEIDIEITSGDGKGEVLKGIYEVGEKRRRICFRGQQGWRPKEFRTQQDDGAVLATFEKQ